MVELSRRHKQEQAKSNAQPKFGGTLSDLDETAGDHLATKRENELAEVEARLARQYFEAKGIRK